MHIQKSAGTSMLLALGAALPPGAIAPQRTDASSFCCFDAFERLRPEARPIVAADEDEVRAMAGYRAVFGHFALPTLASLAPPAQIGTVLREPRSRLLSYYLFLRLDPRLAVARLLGGDRAQDRRDVVTQSAEL